MSVWHFQVDHTTASSQILIFASVIFSVHLVFYINNLYGWNIIVNNLNIKCKFPQILVTPLFESRLRHGCLSLVSVVCCQVEVSATSWSLVQRSPTECVASKKVWSWSLEKWGGLGPQGAVKPLEKKILNTLILARSWLTKPKTRSYIINILITKQFSFQYWHMPLLFVSLSTTTLPQTRTVNHPRSTNKYLCRFLLRSRLLTSPNTAIPKHHVFLKFLHFLDRY
jgi:hypothetical protein